MKVLLFSGGLDSSALAFWKRPELALTVDYGQRPAKGEIVASTAIAAELGISHEILNVDLSRFGSGLLAGKPSSNLGREAEWWPYRNQMLITLAAMRFISSGLRQIMIGTVATDVHGDGTPRFVRAMDELLQVQEGGVRVIAPAQSMTSQMLLRRSHFPRSLLGLTFSCHVLEYACGSCRGCLKHNEVLQTIRSRR